MQSPPDPIIRNRTERRLACVLFAMLLGMVALCGWLGGPPENSNRTVETTVATP